jgi:hypothetical protein
MATQTPLRMGVTAPSSLSSKEKANEATESQDYVTAVTRRNAERKKKVTWGRPMSADRFRDARHSHSAAAMIEPP